MEKSKSTLKDGSSPKVVAELVLKVAKTVKQKFRYLAGADAEQLFETKTKMDEEDFEKFLQDTFGL